MFRKLVIRGRMATITWGYRTAAVMGTWTVARAEEKPKAWELTATVDRADPFQLKQRPLYFTAPRKGGFFRFPVQAITLGKEMITATLGPPEN